MLRGQKGFLRKIAHGSATAWEARIIAIIRRPHLHQLYCFATLSRRVSEDSSESCLKRQPQEASAHRSIFSVRLGIRRDYRALEQHARGNFAGVLFALERFEQCTPKRQCGGRTRCSDKVLVDAYINVWLIDPSREISFAPWVANSFMAL